MSVITPNIPATAKVELEVKLANGKAAEVSRVYLVRGVTVTECNGSSWVVCIPNEEPNVLLPNFNGARVRDNVVVLLEAYFATHMHSAQA